MQRICLSPPTRIIYITAICAAQKNDPLAETAFCRKFRVEGKRVRKKLEELSFFFYLLFSTVGNFSQCRLLLIIFMNLTLFLRGNSVTYDTDLRPSCCAMLS